MNVKSYLTEIVKRKEAATDLLQFPECELVPESIKVIMISEVPPQNPEDGFYSKAPKSDYMKTTLDLFEKAGINVKSIQDILDLGIYVTTAVKIPKTSYAVETDIIKSHLPILEAELALFPNLKVIMLMGDVAKKAVNLIAKARAKKNVIPSKSTYKIRGNEYFWNNTRVFPSYIMTGKNILIEKSKCVMFADDIRRMMALIA